MYTPGTSIRPGDSWSGIVNWGSRPGTGVSSVTTPTSFVLESQGRVPSPSPFRPESWSPRGFGITRDPRVDERGVQSRRRRGPTPRDCGPYGEGKVSCDRPHPRGRGLWGKTEERDEGFRLVVPCPSRRVVPSLVVTELGRTDPTGLGRKKVVVDSRGGVRSVGGETETRCRHTRRVVVSVDRSGGRTNPGCGEGSGVTPPSWKRGGPGGPGPTSGPVGLVVDGSGSSGKEEQ